jgi:hypothetical protein
MRDQPVQRAIVRAFSRLLRLIDSLPDCECAACDDARAMHYTLTLYQACLESQLWPVATKKRNRIRLFVGKEEPCKVS